MKPPIDPPFNNTESCEKYPKILHYDHRHGGLNCVAFEKHDGSNLAWRYKDGAFDVGRFRSGRSIMEEMGTFGDALALFEDKLEKLTLAVLDSLKNECLEDCVDCESPCAKPSKHKGTHLCTEGLPPDGPFSGISEAVLFTEFRGAKSFSGQHEKNDPKTLYPIDLWIKGRGFMPPEDFVNSFSPRGPVLDEHFQIRPVFQGKLTAKVVENIRSGKLKVNEGVVCKGGDWGSVWCCKIKTDAWLARGGEL